MILTRAYPLAGIIIASNGYSLMKNYAHGKIAMFKHGYMSKGIYVDPGRDFFSCYFSLAANERIRSTWLFGNCG